MTLTWEPETQAWRAGHDLGSSVVPSSEICTSRGRPESTPLHNSAHPLSLDQQAPYLQRGVVCPELRSCLSVQGVPHGRAAVSKPEDRALARSEGQGAGAWSLSCRVMTGECSHTGSRGLLAARGLGDTVAEETATVPPGPKTWPRVFRGPSRSPRANCPLPSCGGPYSRTTRTILESLPQPCPARAPSWWALGPMEPQSPSGSLGAKP